MGFLSFVQNNSLSNLAILFLAGVIVGMFGFKWFTKIFWLLIILAILFAGSKTSALKEKWPFNKINQDKISETVKNAAVNQGKEMIKEEIEESANR